MSPISQPLRIALLAAVIVAGPLTFVAAQEIGQSHLAAAERVTQSAPRTADWDRYLFQLAQQTSDRLIRQRPDLFREIAKVVDDVALELVPRRAELDNDIARIWAKNFNEEELKAIDAFFSSDIGKKYKDVAAKTIGPDMLQAAKNWRTRVGDEMLEKATEELKKRGFDL
jgi:hypothetical protein